MTTMKLKASCWSYAQVNRLELTLSIGSFAAALGAMVAGIFGASPLPLTVSW